MKMKEIFQVSGQSADGIVGVGRRLTLLDGSVQIFTWQDYRQESVAKAGDVVRKWTDTGWKFFQVV